MNLTDRFWAKVNKDGPVHPTLGTPCWLWVGCINADGYGRFNVWGPITNAHRVSYELCVGPIPKGLTIDHLCRNHSCVNPAHLEPVTRGENALRGFSPTVVTARTGICKRGHDIGAHEIVTPTGSRCRVCCQEHWRKYSAKNVERKAAWRRARKARIVDVLGKVASK